MDRKQQPLTYRDSGVDIDRQDEALARIKQLVASTKTPGVASDLGGFGGLYRPDLSAHPAPVLVSSCDGVGTKLKVAFDSGVHDTVGRDLVNHCVNDILVQGAMPLFFMDYVATGRLEPGVLASVVEGVARGCRETGMALLGGEIAEMPGFYADGEYDVAGFVVGLVDQGGLIDGSSIEPGDRLLGLPSAGLHTNGYSLARKVFFEIEQLAVDQRVEELGGTVGEILLAEHRCYLSALRGPLERGLVCGLAHITGGGVVDNLPRILPQGSAARIERGSWEVPPVFSYIERVGQVEPAEMDRTFNMGLGMIVATPEANLEALCAMLDEAGQDWSAVGQVTEGSGEVVYV